MPDVFHVELSLGHSPDPDDAFMWWPITGKIEPPAAADGAGPGRVLEPPVLDTGRFAFHAVAADIEALNRRARANSARTGASSLDITALSVRTWADVCGHYAITSCGASFGDGYGPRLITRVSDAKVLCEHCLVQPGLVVAIPGRGTTAFLMVGLLLRDLRAGRLVSAKGCRPPLTPEPSSDEERGGPKFIEMPFDRVIGAVARGEADVGLLIHEGQISFADSGLCMIADVGAWWKQRTGLKLPLGINAVRRDLDERFGAGTIAEVSALLKRSVAHAMAHWEESVEYAMTFAQANARRSGDGSTVSRERVSRYCGMYVTEETRNMGDAGRDAIRRLLREGAEAGLCPDPGEIELA